MAGRIDALIFSKDRGAQLDLLLRSIDRYAASLYRSLTVLWTASDAGYVKGYRLCRELHAQLPGLGWWQEPAGEFEQTVRAWLDAVDATVSFLVDDDVFYRDAMAPTSGLPWSFRGGDYDYPFSLDGNVYAREDVIRLLDGLRFTDPTELEHQGHLHRERLPFTQVMPAPVPCLVGVPANRVSVSSGMPHMGVHEYDLNERFLAGKRLEIPAASESFDAHAAIELIFA